MTDLLKLESTAEKHLLLVLAPTGPDAEGKRVCLPLKKLKVSDSDIGLIDVRIYLTKDEAAGLSKLLAEMFQP